MRSDEELVPALCKIARIYFVCGKDAECMADQITKEIVESKDPAFVHALLRCIDVQKLIPTLLKACIIGGDKENALRLANMMTYAPPWFWTEEAIRIEPPNGVITVEEDDDGDTESD